MGASSGNLDYTWLLYIAAFAVAFALTLFLTPVAKKISIKVGAVDKPKKRGVHKEPIPRLGGIAIVIGFMCSLCMLIPFVTEIQTTQFAGLILGSVIIVTVGIVDDIYDLRASIKLCFQIVAALAAIFSGIQIDFIVWPFPVYWQSLSIPITLIWIIGLTNAVNLIDGLDGLAAGVSSIAALSMMVMCIITGSVPAIFLTAALAGSCLGFLPRNFNPAEIFMGDCGATFLGYVLAVSSVMGLFKGYAILTMTATLLVLALPIFDTTFAIVRRMLRKEPILKADRGHLHHRLIDRGFSHKQTVLVLYILSLVCGIIAILVALKDFRTVIVVIVIATVICLMLLVYRKRLLELDAKKNEAIQKESENI